MATSKGKDNRRAARKELLAWSSFAIFLAGVLFYGCIGAYRGFIQLTGYDMQQPVQAWQLPIFLLCFFLVSGALMYLAAIMWLLFAKLFLTREDVSKVVFYGPTTKFDRWLVDTSFPK